jgi:hypothetical protein
VHEAGESAIWREKVAEGNCRAVPGRCYSCESAVDRPILPSCLKAWRDIGVEPMLYLGFQGIFKWPDSGDGKPRPEAMPPLFPVSPRDIERAAVEWAEYVALFKRVDPGLSSKISSPLSSAGAA